MSERRISAAEAYAKVERVIHSGVALTICRRARDGVLIAKAEVFFWGKERHTDIEIPTEFWWAGGHEALTQNWQSGDFETWIDQKIECRAYGVTFLEADIDAMLPRGAPPLPVVDGKPGNFASSAKCVSEVCAQVKCETLTALQAIIRHCRGRLITARCDEISWQVTDHTGTGHFTEHMVEVPSWVWEHCSSDPETIIDWQSGQVSGRGEIQGNPYRVLIKGLQFDVPGIVNLEAMLLSELPPPRQDGNEGEAPGNRRGKKRDTERWTEWIAELAAHIHESGIPEGRDADGQDELIAAIEERLIARSRQSLGRTTVQPVARAVLLRLRSATN